MGFFKRIKEAKKDKKAKDEVLVVSEMPDDVEQILTMPESLVEEGLITKPTYVEEEKITLTTSESTLPFTAPVEDENYAEAEMLNKMEAEQNIEQVEEKPLIDALSDAVAMEMELDSDELMEILNDLPSEPESVSVPQFEEDEELSKAKQRNAMSQIFAKGSSQNKAFNPSDMQEMFSSKPVEDVQEISPTEKVTNIFGKTNTQSNVTKLTPSELVHNVFGQEQKKQANNELPTRDSMREMLSSQKKKSDTTLPTKNELFKTITNKDK